MGSTNWSDLDNQATDADILAKVTMAPSFYPVDGSFTFGFRSLSASPLFRGKLYNEAGFYPLAASKGGAIHAYMRKDSPLTGVATFAPMIFFCDDKDYANDPEGYILGLSEGAPYNIVFKKGKLSTGLKADAGAGIIVGDVSYAAAQWIGLKLDFIFNPQGDLVFNIFQDSNVDPADPLWERPDGFPTSIVDDNLGKYTGTVPNTAQMFAGFGMYSAQIDCYTAFDFIRMRRQLTP